MDLNAIVEKLYGLPPGEFIARRDQLSATAKKSGDRELAGAIKALRRPSAAAFAMNLMARTRGDRIDELTELGRRMKAAQDARSGDDLRALGRERAQLIRTLSDEVRTLAREAGHPVSESVGREVESTLEAAFADAWSGEALRQGRLVRSLAWSGLGPVDLDGAVAGSLESSSAPTPGPPTAAGPPAPDGHADAVARAREAAEQAETRARDAATRRDAARAGHQAAGLRREHAEAALRALENQVREARASAAAAVVDETAARLVFRDAEAEAEEAVARAREARGDADRLQR